MLIAITGATGFVGRHLVEAHRQRGDRVRILKRARTPKLSIWHDVEVIEGDLSINGSLLENFAAGVDVLYHCAGEIRDERAMHATNVEGTRALVSAAAGRVKHWVQLSSAAVYGGVQRGVIREETAHAPATIYGKTKLASDLVVLSAAAGGAFTCTVLRPTSIIGADMARSLLIRFIPIIDKGLFFFIGPSGAIMNFVHIDNVVSALTLCARQPAAVGRDYIISDQLTMERLAHIVADELGKPVPRLRVPEAPVRLLAHVVAALPFSPLNIGQINVLTARSFYSTERIAGELAYKPVKLPETALRELVAAWKKSRHHAS